MPENISIKPSNCARLFLSPIGWACTLCCNEDGTRRKEPGFSKWKICPVGVMALRNCWGYKSGEPFKGCTIRD